MLSVVIPALNAAATLPDCLASLGEVEELIIVDGGSTDGTTKVAGPRLIQSPRGRGTQLRSGAEAAQGDWLLFLHADTRLGAGWRGAADAHMARRPDRAACFRFRLDERVWQARLIEQGVAVRAGVLGLPYGDQGLLISRELYREVGGYSALPLMEDVDLVRRLGRSRIVMLDAEAITSAERWRRDGWFRRSARNLACFALYRLGMSPERVARLYA